MTWFDRAGWRVDTGAMRRRFSQVDVFSATPTRGNPLAVVHDADGLSDDQMSAIARWTNLSETTFLVAPTDTRADYRVRIFTPAGELPFAGHPTLGTCSSWLRAGGSPAGETIVQECLAGLIPVRRDGDRLAFAAPPLRRSGPVRAADLDPVLDAFGLAVGDVVDAAWADNGPGWMALQLPSVAAVLALEPDFVDAKVGVVALDGDGAGERPAEIEVRAFFAVGRELREDPVTGSLNASLAQWLIEREVVTAPYLARQGTALGRAGRVWVTSDDDGIWIGGDVVTVVDGTIDC